MCCQPKLFVIDIAFVYSHTADTTSIWFKFNTATMRYWRWCFAHSTVCLFFFLSNLIFDLIMHRLTQYNYRILQLVCGGNTRVSSNERRRKKGKKTHFCTDTIIKMTANETTARVSCIIWARELKVNVNGCSSLNSFSFIILFSRTTDKCLFRFIVSLSFIVVSALIYANFRIHIQKIFRD